MDQDNPLVKENAADTLTELVNTMIYVVDTMPSLEQSLGQLKGQAENEDEDDDDLLIYMQCNQYSGLKNTIDVIRAAAESCFSQHTRELAAKGELISQLQQFAAKAKTATETQGKD